MTGAGLNYWHWFNGKSCGEPVRSEEEKLNCENVSQGTIRCDSDGSGTQICFSGVWKKAYDCLENTYCPAGANSCQETCTAIEAKNCLTTNQVCRRHQCVSQFVYYSQRDPRWGNKLLPGGCSEPLSDNTMKASICGPTSDAMLLATYVSANYTPESVVEQFFPEITCYGTSLDQHEKLLTSFGFTLKDRYLSQSALAGFIKNNPNVVFLVHISYKNAYGGLRGHFTIVSGVDAQGNLIFQDPYFGDSVTAASLPQNFEMTDVVQVTPPQGG